jgi:hypothetical protein
LASRGREGRGRESPSSVATDTEGAGHGRRRDARDRDSLSHHGDGAHDAGHDGHDDGDAVETVDVLVVGAGVSGLFCAARIRERHPHLTVAVVERSDEVGGRLQSLPVQGSETAVELGGMRTFPDIDHYTGAALRMAGVRTVEVPYVTPRNLAYVRGRRVRMADLPSAAASIYGLAHAECDKSPTELLQTALDRELAAEGIVVAAMRRQVRGSADGGDAEAGAASAVENVQHVQRTACADPALGRTTLRRVLLDRGLSQEAFQYAVDVSGYGFARGPISAAAGIRQEYSLSGANSAQHWIVGGYRSLPLALYERLCAERMHGAPASSKGGAAAAAPRFKIAFNAELAAMRLLPGGRPCSECRHGERHRVVECRLRGTSARTFVQRTDDGPSGARDLSAADDSAGVAAVRAADDRSGKAGREWTVRARHVILTTPRDDLERIDAPWPERVRAIFGAVEAWRGVKVYLWFDRAWWEDAGKNVTDLPARQVWFPFGRRLPVALIYCDQEDSDFWVDLLPNSPDAVEPLRWHPADRAPRLVAEALRQIALVMGVERARMGRVVKLTWRHWPYGTTFWRSERHPVGSVSAMRREIITPMGPSVPVLVVGDSFSWSQGWVDGALETADLALRTYWAVPSVLSTPDGADRPRRRGASSSSIGDHRARH